MQTLTILKFLPLDIWKLVTTSQNNANFTVLITPHLIPNVEKRIKFYTKLLKPDLQNLYTKLNSIHSDPDTNFRLIRNFSQIIKYATPENQLNALLSIKDIDIYSIILRSISYSRSYTKVKESKADLKVFEFLCRHINEKYKDTLIYPLQSYRLHEIGYTDTKTIYKEYQIFGNISFYISEIGNYPESVFTDKHITELVANELILIDDKKAIKDFIHYLNYCVKELDFEISSREAVSLRSKKMRKLVKTADKLVDYL